jgi:hypothetical protein
MAMTATMTANWRARDLTEGPMTVTERPRVMRGHGHASVVTRQAQDN